MTDEGLDKNKMTETQADRLVEFEQETEKGEERPDFPNREAETETRKETKNKPSGSPKLRHWRKTSPIPSYKDEVIVKVEKIMEEGLNDAYARLSPIAQQEFKIKGEKTATAIAELLRSTHVKIKKIFRLLVEWLKMLPGINKFFLEQEAKIKTDRILEITKRRE